MFFCFAFPSLIRTFALKMRTKSVVILLFAVILAMLASTSMPSWHRVDDSMSPSGIAPLKDTVPPTKPLTLTPDTTLPRAVAGDSLVASRDSLVLSNDSLNGIGDSLVVSTSNEPDTLSMDSLQLAIYHHNKAIDDSLRLDSTDTIQICQTY